MTYKIRGTCAATRGCIAILAQHLEVASATQELLHIWHLASQDIPSYGRDTNWLYGTVLLFRKLGIQNVTFT